MLLGLGASFHRWRCCFVRRLMTGLNPAWRTALAHIVLGGSWLEGVNANGIRRIEDKPKGYLASLEGLVGPDGGGYLDEANLHCVLYEF
ncbi:hypothetical protein F5050DRAFT_1808233 [Lentinula boryana]|uniref:Uncharacterized protein n=1 Tax=Lentinula boryana TaxID=40481 RepID=A0ABQ8QBS1_9AGAR|nr:hypothetical protein F5050DRAFT_1808233 [Lentinula boryana]